MCDSLSINLCECAHACVREHKNPCDFVWIASERVWVKVGLSGPMRVAYMSLCVCGCERMTEWVCVCVSVLRALVCVCVYTISTLHSPSLLYTFSLSLYSTLSLSPIHFLSLSLYSTPSLSLSPLHYLYSTPSLSLSLSLSGQHSFSLSLCAQSPLGLWVSGSLGL